MAPEIVPFGDGALLVRLDTVTSGANARRARRLAAGIDELREADAGIGTPVAAAASVLVPFDPLLTDPGELVARIERVLDAEADDVTPPPGPGPRVHELQVRYGGDHGPDLDDVAAEIGVGANDVIELHAGRDYEVLFLGFAPGFAYLGEVHARLVVPRLATPRVRVPRGSVAIAGSMTAVYPQASPGGWRILGRTEADLFDPSAVPPARFRPGDRVRFIPVR
jgi:KipI family sensor histidine kinase inhibitor